MFEHITSHWSEHSCWRLTDSNLNCRSATCARVHELPGSQSLFCLWYLSHRVIIIFKQDNAHKIHSTVFNTCKQTELAINTVKFCSVVF